MANGQQGFFKSLYLVQYLGNETSAVEYLLDVGQPAGYSHLFLKIKFFNYLKAQQGN